MIGILALQGAFLEHEHMLKKLDVEYFEIRQRSDLERPMDGLILPGGESTVQGKLLRELELFTPIKTMIQNGLPVLGTCAGLILLAEKQTGSNDSHFGTLPVCIKRNGYGRQLGSFITKEEYHGIGKIPMTFIRAPYIDHVQDGVRVTAITGQRIVGVEYKNQIGVAFHPELDDDLSIHKRFLSLIE